MKKPRILLADDHRIVAEGVQGLLEPEFELVGIVSDGQRAGRGRQKTPARRGRRRHQHALAQRHRRRRTNSPSRGFVQGRLLDHATRRLLRAAGDGGRGVGLRPETFRPRRAGQGDTGCTPWSDLRDPAHRRGASPLLSRRWAATRSNGPAIDTSPARSLAAFCRGPVGQGSCDTPAHLNADRRIPSSSRHEGARGPDHGRAGPVRDRERHHIRLTGRPRCADAIRLR